MKSNAPSLVASTAVLTVPWPEMMTTGSASLTWPDPLQRLEAVHARHLDVEEHEIRRLALDERQPLRTARRLQHVVALVLEDHPHRPPDLRFVVDDQNA